MYERDSRTLRNIIEFVLFALAVLIVWRVL